MPRLTRYFIKTALLYLVAAMTLGVVLGVSGRGAQPVWLAHMRPVYFHLLMVGWVAQLIFGVAYWMFPKYSQAKPRGNESLAWAVYWLLNSGLLLRAVAEPLYGTRGDAFLGYALGLSAILQWLAALAFAANSWPRLKER